MVLETVFLLVFVAGRETFRIPPRKTYYGIFHRPLNEQDEEEVEDEKPLYPEVEPPPGREFQPDREGPLRVTDTPVQEPLPRRTPPHPWQRMELAPLF